METLDTDKSGKIDLNEMKTLFKMYIMEAERYLCQSNFFLGVFLNIIFDFFAKLFKLKLIWAEFSLN